MTTICIIILFTANVLENPFIIPAQVETQIRYISLLLFLSLIFKDESLEKAGFACSLVCFHNLFSTEKNKNVVYLPLDFQFLN